jgi:hypothetical protein
VRAITIVNASRATSRIKVPTMKAKKNASIRKPSSKMFATLDRPFPCPGD